MRFITVDYVNLCDDDAVEFGQGLGHEFVKYLDTIGKVRYKYGT